MPIPKPRDSLFHLCVATTSCLQGAFHNRSVVKTCLWNGNVSENTSACSDFLFFIFLTSFPYLSNYQKVYVEDVVSSRPDSLSVFIFEHTPGKVYNWGSWAKGDVFSGLPTGFNRWARKVPLPCICLLGNLRRGLPSDSSLKIFSLVSESLLTVESPYFPQGWKFREE